MALNPNWSEGSFSSSSEKTFFTSVVPQYSTTLIIPVSFNKLVLAQLQAGTNLHTDLLQFAYQQQRRVDDAVLAVVHGAFSHL